MPPAPLSLELKDDRPSFCRSVGWPGVGLYVLAFAVAGAHLFLAYGVTYFFQHLDHEGAWALLEEKRLDATMHCTNRNAFV